MKFNIKAGDRVSIVSTENGRRYFGTVSWVGDGQAAVWWDTTGGGWRGPTSWLRKEGAA